MTKKILLSIASCLLLAAMVVAVSCKKDDQKPSVRNFTNTQCLGEDGYAKSLADGYDSLKVDFDGRTANIAITGWWVNCGFTSTSATVKSTDSTLAVTLSYAGSLANCLCPIDASFEVVDIPKGHIHFTVNLMDTTQTIYSEYHNF